MPSASSQSPLTLTEEREFLAEYRAAQPEPKPWRFSLKQLLAWTTVLALLAALPHWLGAECTTSLWLFAIVVIPLTRSTWRRIVRVSQKSDLRNDIELIIQSQALVGAWLGLAIASLFWGYTLVGLPANSDWSLILAMGVICFASLLAAFGFAFLATALVACTSVVVMPLCRWFTRRSAKRQVVLLASVITGLLTAAVAVPILSSLLDAVLLEQSLLHWQNTSELPFEGSLKPGDFIAAGLLFMVMPCLLIARIKSPANVATPPPVVDEQTDPDLKKLAASEDPQIQDLLKFDEPDERLENLTAAWFGTSLAGALFPFAAGLLGWLLEMNQLAIIFFLSPAALIVGFCYSAFIAAPTAAVVGAACYLLGFRRCRFAIGSLVGGWTGLICVGLLSGSEVHNLSEFILATGLAIVMGQAGAVWTANKVANLKTQRIFKVQKSPLRTQLSLRQMFSLMTLCCAACACLSALQLNTEQYAAIWICGAWLSASVACNLILAVTDGECST